MGKRIDVILMLQSHNHAMSTLHYTSKNAVKVNTQEL